MSEAYGLHVPKGTVQNWILGIHNPSRRLHRYFEPTPSPELSYLIGAVLGDGYTTEDQGRGIVGFTNKDVDLLKHFLSCVSQVLGVPSAGRITSGTPYGTRKATVGSTLLTLFLRNPLHQLAPFIERHPGPFISGFFDAEGSCATTISRGRLVVGLNASNTDLRMLQYIRTLLRNRFQIQGSITVGRRPCRTSIHGKEVQFKNTVFRLGIRRHADVETFAARIGFASERKGKILRYALALLHEYGGKDAATHWLDEYVKTGYRWIKKDSA